MKTEEPRGFVYRADPSFKEVEVIAISDVHYGNPLFSLPHFIWVIEYIQSRDNVFVLLNGDLCEAAIRTSKGDIFRQVGTPQDQRDWIIEKLYPIKERIMGITDGNHEARIYGDTGIDLTKDIATTLDAPYRETGLPIRLYFGDNAEGHPGRQHQTEIYAQHGYGGARTNAAKAVKVERMSTFVNADVYFMSHDHVVNIARIPYLEYDRNIKKDKATGRETFKLIEKPKTLIKTNAYVKWGGYAEKGGFSPNSLTTPIVKLSTKNTKEVLIRVVY